MPINAQQPDSVTESVPKKQKKTVLLQSLSSAVAAVLEVGFFHPVDTVQKRLMVNSKPIYDKQLSLASNLTSACNIAFRSSKTNQFSLYPGLPWALTYKVSQRVIKFGGQPIIEEALKRQVFKPDTSFWPAATSGALIGACEVLIVPLDIYKIRKQTNSSDKGMSYRGAGVTVVRNMVGSFTLFGMPELIRSYFWRGEPSGKTQKIASQFLAAASCIVVASPFDVVKTRMQSDSHSQTAYKMASQLLKNNPSQFFKGIGPKALAQSLKLTGFMTVKDMIAEKIEPGAYR